MKITRLHRRVAEALCSGRASPEEIRRRFRISPATLARWEADPDFQDLIRVVEERCRRRARWLLVASAELAAQRLVKLTEAENPETARKACLDVLNRAEISRDAEEASREGIPPQVPIDSETRRRIYELLCTPPRGEKRSTPSPGEGGEGCVDREARATTQRVVPRSMEPSLDYPATFAAAAPPTSPLP